MSDERDTTLIFSKRASTEAANPLDQRTLKLTIAFHPNRDRIGQHITLAVRHKDHTYGKRVFSISRDTPAFEKRDGESEVAGRAPDRSFLGREGRLFNVSRAGIMDIELNERQVFFRPVNETLSDEVLVAGSSSLSQPRSIEDLAEGIIFKPNPFIVLIIREVFGSDDAETPASSNDIWETRFSGVSAEARRIRREAKLALNALKDNEPVLIVGEEGVGKFHLARAMVNALENEIDRVPKLQAGEDPFETFIPSSIQDESRQEVIFGREGGEGVFGRASIAMKSVIMELIDKSSVPIQQTLAQALAGQVVPLHAATYEHDCRILATAYVPLEKADVIGKVKGFFGSPIRLPPLRHRPEDIAFALHDCLCEEDNPWNLGYEWYEPLPNADGELTEEIKLDIEQRRNKDALWASTIFKILTSKIWPSNLDGLKRFVKDPNALHSFESNRPEERPVTAGRTKPSGLSGIGRLDAVNDKDLYELGEAFDWNWKAVSDHLNVPRTSLIERLKTHPDIRRPNDLSLADLMSALAEHGDDIDAAAASLKISRRQFKTRKSKLEKA